MSDRIKPILLVRVNGTSLSERERPLTLSIEHTEFGNGGRELRATISNPNLELLDDPDFQEGQGIQWRFGYAGNLSPLYIATIYAVEPNFDPWNGLSLTLYAYDGITRLLGRHRQTVWRHPTDAVVTQSWVVQQIAADYGLNAVVEDTRGNVTEIAQNGFDWDFIQNVLVPDAVAANDKHAGAYRAWLDSKSGDLHFQPAPYYLKPSKTYRFMLDDEEPSLISFRPKLNIQRPDETAAAGTTARDVDGNGNIVDAPSTPSTATRVSSGSRSANFVTGEWGPNEPGAVINDPSSADPAATQATPKDRAGQTLARAEESSIETEIVLVGDPSLRANDIIEVRGVGKKFSGAYLCDQVRHRLDADIGFVTEVTALSNAAKADASGNLASSPEGDIGEPGNTAENPDAKRVSYSEVTGEVQ